MATIRREVRLAAPMGEVWDALRDVGALATRLAPGFVTDCVSEPGARVVTFANGLRVREIIMGIDVDAHRVAWSVVDSPNLTHHHSSAQLFADEGGTRFVWITDVLPDAAAPAVAGMMEAGLTAIAGRFGRR